jgi:hypothetical protein
MPTSVRVDEETEALLERAARIRAETKSELIRRALKQFCSRIVMGKALTPYESIKGLLGCAEGPRDLARRSRDYLQEAFRGQKPSRPR